MFMHPQYAVATFIPTIVGEGLSQQASSPLSPQRLMTLYNTAYMHMCNLADKSYRTETVTYRNTNIIDTDTGELDSMLPVNQSRFVCMTYGQFETPTSEELTVAKTYRFGGVTISPNENGFRYDLRGNRLFVLQYPWPAGGNPGRMFYRIWYAKVQPAMHYGLTGSGQTSSNSVLYLNTAPTAGIFERPADRYVDAKVYIYEGPGAGQFARIYSMSGTVATCRGIDSSDTSPFTVPITNASYYCIMPWFPDSYLTALGYLTASYIPRSQIATEIGPTVKEQMDLYKAWLAAPDLSSGKPMGHKFRNDMGKNSGGGLVGYGSGGLTYFG